MYLVQTSYNSDPYQPTLYDVVGWRKPMDFVTQQQNLTLKAAITTAADDIHKYSFIDFQRK